MTAFDSTLVMPDGTHMAMRGLIRLSLQIF